jgi:hypothetical protein
MSPAFDRRRFFTASAGLAATFTAGAHLFGRDGANTLDALFLSWRKDPTTTMTVTWLARANDTSDTTVRYRPHGKTETAWATGPAAASKPFPVIENASIRAEAEKAAKEKGTKLDPVPADTPKFTGPSDLVVRSVEITGLAPGTEYEFTVGGGVSNRFRTMPVKATKAFTFVSGGDCGVNAHVLANNRIAATQDPMFVLIGGDLGYDNGINGNTALAFIRNYARTMIDTAGRLIPLVTCLGNHEVRGGAGKTLKEATFFTPFFGGLYPERGFATLDFGDYLSLVLLDSGHATPVAGEQTMWLDKALRERTGKAHMIPVNHVPCYPSYREPTGQKGALGTGEAQRKHWCPLFEKYGVDVVLEHHDHTYKRTRPLTDGKVDTATGVTYLGDGSWGKLRVPKTPEMRPYLDEVSQSYHLTLHRLEGEQRFHLALGETGKVLDIHRSGKRPLRRTPGVTTG